MPKQQNKVPDFQKIGKKLIHDATRIASVECLNFFTRSFEQHGWTDTAFQPWQARKSDGQDGGNLMQPTGNLRDSLQILQRSGNKARRKIIFGTHVPYAKVHNEGGTINRTINVRVTEKSRKFFWKMYYNTKEVKWKWMALTKKSSLTIKQTIHMPKRQFIGHSDTMMKHIHKLWCNRLEKEFKQVVNSTK